MSITTSCIYDNASKLVHSQLYCGANTPARQQTNLSSLLIYISIVVQTRARGSSRKLQEHVLWERIVGAASAATALPVTIPRMLRLTPVILLLIASTTFAGPVAAPGDSGLRHDIQMVGD